MVSFEILHGLDHLRLVVQRLWQAIQGASILQLLREFGFGVVESHLDGNLSVHDDYMCVMCGHTLLIKETVVFNG